MISFRQFIIFICLNITSTTSIAQPYVDLFSVQGVLTKSDDIVSNHKYNVNTDFLSVQLSYPHQFKNKSILVVSSGYDKWNLSSTAGESNLETGYLPVTFIKPFSQKWKCSLTAIPRFNRERGRTFDQATMQWGGAFIATRILSPHFIVKAGLYYNKEFFGNYFLPLIGGEWKPNERMSIFGLLPNNLFIDYKLSETIHTGFVFKGITASFRLKVTNNYDYIRMEEGQFKFFADFYVKKNIVINIEAGHTLKREYGFGFLNKESTSAEFNDGYLLKAGIYYRLWL